MSGAGDDDHPAEGGLRYVEKSDKPSKRPPPRYIANLLKTAEYRKAERELTKEKMIRLERERLESLEHPQRTGDEEVAKPAPVYVTQGYLKRMKERELALKELNN